MTIRFNSFLAKEFESFLDFKRSRGHPYVRGEKTLESFDRFVDERTARGRLHYPFEELLSGWLARSGARKPVSVALELGVIRQFCSFCRRYRDDHFVPGREWAPQSTTSDFLPCVLSEHDIRCLLEATNRLRDLRMYRITIRTIVMVLYCTGLRLGEAVRLRTSDVDFSLRLFRIAESKGKSRLVPFRSDLAEVLRKYAQERRRAFPVYGDNQPFFVRHDGTGVTVKSVSAALRRLMRSTGLKPPSGRLGPRPYDLRHAFAVERLTAWYRSKADFEACLPLLSAYMGHDNILGTEKYLHVTPELLARAGRLLEERFSRGCHEQGAEQDTPETG